MSFFDYKFKAPSRWEIGSEIHVDLGAGSYPRNPFKAKKVIAFDVLDPSEISIDSQSEAYELEYLQVSRFKEFPIGDQSVGSISGFDFLEHLSREPNGNNNEFIFVMNEVYRILKPGGYALFVTPAYPLRTAFQDPTHVNILTRDTYEYFCGSAPLAQKLGYGFQGEFELLAQFWAGPFSNVWKYPNDGKRVGTFRNRVNFSIIRFLEIARFKFRRTHLVWILHKPFQ